MVPVLPLKQRILTATATMATTKLPISLLPLPPSTHILTENLTPDENVPSVRDFRTLRITKPSLQRRARLLPPQSHFSYTSPFPLSFPYHVTAPDPPEAVIYKSEWVEKWLSAREALHERSATNNHNKLAIYYPENRDQPRELIGLSETGLKDCLPLLDVGDAFATLGTPSLAHYLDDDPRSSPPSSEVEVAARQELIDVLSGHCLLMSSDSGSTTDSEQLETVTAFAPWSLRYSVHQFGSWAGQLGDGRAISVCEHVVRCNLVIHLTLSSKVVTPHLSDPDLTYELQLKGAGRTPFSRTADGLAVLRSSIREFLCSEGKFLLCHVTSRDLSHQIHQSSNARTLDPYHTLTHAHHPSVTRRRA